MARRLHSLRLTACILILSLAALGAASAQAPAHKKVITHNVYDSWKSIQGTTLSKDGVWLAYALVPQDGDGELVVRNLRTNTEYRAPRGKDPIITNDARFVVFSLTPTKVELDRARKAKKKPDELPKPGVGVVDLSTGRTVTVVEHAKSFKVPGESSHFIAALTVPPEKKATDKPAAEKPPEPGVEAPKKREKKKEIGTDLIVRELGTGAQATIGDVSDYAISKDAVWLAYAVSSATPANDGAFARRLADGTTRTLMAGQGNYKGLAFDGRAAALAFVSDCDDYQAAAPVFRLYLWQTTTDAATELKVPNDARGALVVSEHGKLEFSKDGARLFFGTAPPPKPEPDESADSIKVDIWHYQDPELQPMQKVRAEQEKKRSYRALFHLADKRFVQLATPDIPELKTAEATSALGISNVPYRQQVSWDGSYDDFYTVNLVDGTRQRIIERAHFASLSPGGGYVLFFDEADDNWYAVRTSDGQKANLTRGLGVKFASERWDTPDHPRPYGHAGWTEGDKSVLLYDRYDIWEVAPDGTGAHAITAGLGRRQQLVFRYASLEPAPPAPQPEEGQQVRRPDPPAIPTTRPVILSAVDERTKGSGIYRVSLADKAAAPVRLFMLDKAVGVPLKAKDADVYAFTLSRFDEFPDLWVSSGAFTDVKKVSNANPQQAGYNWGRSELIDYVNADGRPLRAILTRPEDFDPLKKYPLIVYIYEQLTENVHRYVPPAPGGSSINVTRYVSNGYIVLQPDIVYDRGYPGQSALKCVLPAVQKVLAMGFVDPARVGIQGHSWGGYQVSYMITQTNMFRAVEAGASVVDMFSAYGGIRWGTGMSRAFQYEKTQSRIGVPPWEQPQLYLENSPLLWIEKIHTPYLTMANDEDDAVPWYQGIEFFTAMRRLGKEAYMFVYNGEKHGLRQRENQKHWTVHLAEYFDYYLKGAPMPDWMANGVPYLEKGKRDVSSFYRKSTDEDR